MMSRNSLVPVYFLYLCTINLNINMPQNKTRIIQFEVLRVIAAFAVVMLHTTAQRFNESFLSTEWDIRNLYDSFVRWSVPIFVMISGALFLDSKKIINVKTLYSKNIARLFFILVLWSIIYGVDNGLRGYGFSSLASRIIQGPVHLWFLKMLIGLYIAVPILRAVVTDVKLERYFLCVSFVFIYFIPMLFPLLKEELRNLFENVYQSFEIKTVSGYAGYFVLGHYLANNAVRKTTKTIIYVLGLLSPVAVCILTRSLSIHDGAPNLLYYENINLFTLFESVAIFLFVNNKKIASKYHPFILFASKLSLGIYIIHPLILNHYYDLCSMRMVSSHPLAFLPVDAILIFLVSLLVTLVLSRIPYIRKIVT